MSVRGQSIFSGRQALFCRTLVKPGLTDPPHIICDLNCLFGKRDAPAFLGMNQTSEITQTFCTSGQRCICGSTAGSNSLECSQVCNDVLRNCMPSALPWLTNLSTISGEAARAVPRNHLLMPFARHPECRPAPTRHQHQQYPLLASKTSTNASYQNHR